MMENDGIFNKIAEALLSDYSSVYYVNAVTNEYHWYSINPEFRSLQIEQGGEDFFVNMARDARQVVYEEDLHIFLEEIQKEKLLQEMKSGMMQNIEYRLMIDGKPVYHSLRLIREVGEQDDYFILGVINVDREVRERIENEELIRKHEVFNQIAESLAAHYDVIYYVDCETGKYDAYTSNDIYGNLEIRETGNDFFEECKANSRILVHKDDVDRVTAILERDYLITTLDNRKRYSADYRLMINGIPQYTRLTVMWASDRIHFVIGVENITEEVRKENEHILAINFANEQARRDELTGIKNKKGYREMEDSIQQKIEMGVQSAFAMVVCDLNNLKKINDTKGHKAGDDYIRSASKLICNTFDHSPVFRIGGDEFVAVLIGDDYQNRERLFRTIRAQVLENQDKEDGPVIATGMALFDPEHDTKISDVFEHADRMMYDNKRSLKERAGESSER